MRECRREANVALDGGLGELRSSRRVANWISALIKYEVSLPEKQKAHLPLDPCKSIYSSIING